ncbi:MAG: hypothetical protein ACOYD4_03925 [Solirubrobacterales bacterium]
MPDKPFTQGTEYAALSAFLGGVNSGLQPILLTSEQLAFATNCTVRGGFVTHRPPYRKITLGFNGAEALQEAFEQGFYQGGIPYRPDFGNHSLVAAINGVLFKVSISGSTGTVTDVSVPGDPNPALTSQAWLWQAEKWVIWNNGVNLPVFFDGVSSRRSFGPSVVLGTATAFSVVAPPPIGATVEVTLTAPYTGKYNIPVVFNGAFYQVVVSPSLTPVYPLRVYPQAPPTATGTFIVGDLIQIRPDIAGWAQNTQNLIPNTSGTVATNPGYNWGASSFCVLYHISTKPLVGSTINFRGTNLTVIHSYANDVADYLWFVYFAETMGANAGIDGIMTFSGSSSPTVNVGRVVTAITVDPGDPFGSDIDIDTNYSGPTGRAWIIRSGSYIPLIVAALSDPPPSILLNLMNLDDETVANYVNPSDIVSIPELPAGRMGAYVFGRNWESLLDGVSFVAGNIVGGEAGTQAEAYRDAVLKMTENLYLTTGVFRLPGSGDVITAICATANLDASMGQGSLIVCTANTIFTCNAPVDRTTWQDVTWPILATTLLGSGALAQQSTFPVNSDTFMRATDGWRSYKIAKRNFSEEWGNTPITREMERVLNLESKPLVPYASGIMFDNRALFGARPQSTASGIATVATVGLNLDPVSTISEKNPPIYDGAWENLKVLQFMRAVIDAEDRCFAFVQNPDTLKIELWEILPSSVSSDKLDASVRILEDNNGAEMVPITWSFESSVLFKEAAGRPLLRLIDGEIRVKDIVGTVDFQIWYKADDYPCWTPWHRWSVCATPASTDAPDNKPGYAPRMGLGEPPLKAMVDGVEVVYCDPFTERPLREGYTFQIKVSVRGHCTFLGLTAAAVRQPETSFAKPICEYSQDP